MAEEEALSVKVGDALGDSEEEEVLVISELGLPRVLTVLVREAVAQTDTVAEDAKEVEAQTLVLGVTLSEYDGETGGVNVKVGLRDCAVEAEGASVWVGRGLRDN